MAATTLSRFLDGHDLRVLDIGARGDLAVRFRPVAGNTEVIGFEPDAAECKRLRDQLVAAGWRGARVLPYAVGETRAARPFYVTEAPELSSLLEPNPALATRQSWAVKEVIQLPTTSLDDLVERGELPDRVDFIKVDTQGSELEILRSGERALLANLLGAECEVEFAELYRGQPRFSEVELYLRDQGFDLLLLEPAHIRSDFALARKRTSFADALFLRGNAWVQSRADAQRAGDLRRLIAIYLLYGLFQEAYQLASAHDDALAAGVKQTYEALPEPDLRWRLAVLWEGLRCTLQPDRAQRLRLARRLRTLNGPDGLGWPLDPP